MPNRLAAALLALLCLTLPAAAADISSLYWQENDGANTYAPPNGFPTGMAPTQVQPSMRAVMGAIKRWYNHANATVTSSGTANAQALNYEVKPESYQRGDAYAFIAGHTNTGPATLDICDLASNCLGAKSIKKGGSVLSGGEIAAGQAVLVFYDGIAFQLLSGGVTVGGGGGTAANWVADNGALALANAGDFPNGVWRLDVAAGRGAGPLLFVPQTGTCVLNGMVNDIGACVNSIDGNSWAARPTNGVHDVRQFNAVGDDATDDSNAFAAWYAALISSGKPGFIPAGTYKITTPIYWDLTNAAATGLTIRGAGLQKSILNLTTGSGPALRVGGSPGSYFYPNLTEFGVRCSLAGVCVEFGHPDFSDPINVATLDLWVGNTDVSTSAVACRFNYYLNSPSSALVCNTGGGGVALDLRQATFNAWSGSFSTASKGIWFRDGYNYGNVFKGINIENISGGTTGGPIVSDVTTASNNIWIGGTAVWHNSDANGGGARINAGSNNFEFRGFQWSRNDAGSIYPIAIGASAAVVQDNTAIVGTYNFEAVQLAPRDKDAKLTSLIPGGLTGGILMKNSSSTALWELVTAGSGGPLNIARYSGGVAVDNPLSISNTTGLATFADGISIAAGGLGVNAGGVTVTAGGVTVNGGGLTVNSGNVAFAGNVTGGTWQASAIQPAYGGTGANNGSNTISIGGNLSISSALTFTGTGTPNFSMPAGAFTYTLPSASGTFATLDGTESLTNKTLDSPVVFGTPKITLATSCSGLSPGMLYNNAGTPAICP